MPGNVAHRDGQPAGRQGKKVEEVSANLGNRPAIAEIIQTFDVRLPANQKTALDLARGFKVFVNMTEKTQWGRTHRDRINVAHTTFDAMPPRNADSSREASRKELLSAAPCRPPYSAVAGNNTIDNRETANFSAPGWITLTWQVYLPGCILASGRLKRMGTAFDLAFRPSR